MNGRSDASVNLRRAAAVIVGVSLGMSLLVAIGLSTSAHYTHHGCTYDADSIDPISYRFFSVQEENEDAFTDAEDRWDRSAAPGYFSEQSWSWDPEINVIDEFGLNNVAAFVSVDCDDDGTYTGNEVQLEYNIFVMRDLSSDDRERVSMHELGHIYGLNHTSGGCHVMQNGSSLFGCSLSGLPHAHDVDGVEELYP